MFPNHYIHFFGGMNPGGGLLHEFIDHYQLILAHNREKGTDRVQRVDSLN